MILHGHFYTATKVQDKYNVHQKGVENPGTFFNQCLMSNSNVVLVGYVLRADDRSDTSGSNGPGDRDVSKQSSSDEESNDSIASDRSDEHEDTAPTSKRKKKVHGFTK